MAFGNQAILCKSGDEVSAQCIAEKIATAAKTVKKHRM